jgi:hypothetical protein
MRSPAVPFLVPILLLLAAPAMAQRGGPGRGRPDAILERVGCWFVDAKVETGADAVAGNPFAGVKQVQEAAAAHLPAVLFLYDPKTEERKYKQYEQTMFNSDELGTALRCFRCVRLDVTTQTEFVTRFGAQVPLFVAFDEDGKKVGEVVQTGNKSAVNPVVQLLEKAVSGRVKPSLSAFVQSYRDVVHDLEMLDSKRKTLADRKSNVSTKDTAKRADIDKEGKALDTEEKDLLAKEKTLLEQAKVVARDPAAKRVGERDRGGK